MPVEEAAELARRAIYHATFRDGASGGVASGMSTFCWTLDLFYFTMFASVPLLPLNNIDKWINFFFFIFIIFFRFIFKGHFH